MEPLRNETVAEDDQELVVSVETVRAARNRYQLQTDGNDGGMDSNLNMLTD